jgi:hypothetical protein
MARDDVNAFGAGFDEVLKVTFWHLKDVADDVVRLGVVAVFTNVEQRCEIAFLWVKVDGENIEPHSVECDCEIGGGGRFVCAAGFSVHDTTNHTSSASNRRYINLWQTHVTTICYRHL